MREQNLVRTNPYHYQLKIASDFTNHKTAPEIPNPNDPNPKAVKTGIGLFGCPKMPQIPICTKNKE